MAYVVPKGSRITLRPAKGEAWEAVADTDYRFEFRSGDGPDSQYCFDLNRLLSIVVRDADVEKVDGQRPPIHPIYAWTGK